MESTFRSQIILAILVLKDIIVQTMNDILALQDFLEIKQECHHVPHAQKEPNKDKVLKCQKILALRVLQEHITIEKGVQNAFHAQKDTGVSPLV